MKHLLLIVSILTLLSCSSSGAGDNSSASSIKSEPSSEPSISSASSTISSEQRESEETSSEAESVTNEDSSVSSSASEDVKTALEIVNDLLGRDYTSGRFASSISKDEMELNSSFLIQINGDTSTVEYQVERYALLDIDNPNPSGEKTLIKGKIEWRNGERRVISGEDIAIDIGEFTLASYALDKNNIAQEESSAGYFWVSLTDPQAYLGEKKPVYDFHISFLYDEERITNMEYSYTDSEGYLVAFSFDNLA